MASALGNSDRPEDADGPRTAQSLGSGNGALAQQSVAGTPLPAPLPIDLLLSFAFHPKRDHRLLHSRLPPGSLLWIDSGAFTAYTTGAKLTREHTPAGSAALVNATHSCSTLRGVRTPDPMTTTSLTGAFREDPAARAEFLAAARWTPTST